MKNSEYDFSQLKVFRSGMDLYDRKKLYKTVIPIPNGTKLYKAGDFADCTQLVTVGEGLHTQEICTMFFGCLYFLTFEDAEKITTMAHANYGEYQAECCRR